MNSNIFNGFINISGDPMYCYTLSRDLPNTKVISLDEDNSYRELAPNLNPNVLLATIMLPPAEVLWAETDGDEYKFSELYLAHLSSLEITDFIMTLIAFVNRGGNIVIFLPEFEPNIQTCSRSVQFLYNFFWQAYGIHLGTSELDQFSFDVSCMPMYAIMLYERGLIDPYNFLIYYPPLATISTDMYMKLIIDINPYGDTFDDKVKTIDQIRSDMIRTGKELINPIIDIRR